ncbi:hypothetical protein GCM10027417_16800 [Glutamicibacter endophyticus]
MAHSEVIDWLLDSDPAIRWQVERDLLGASESVWKKTRAAVSTSGMGARLLRQRGDDGLWAGGPFFPAGWDMEGGGPQPWTATTWVLKDLREWGVAASALGDTAHKLESVTWEYDDLPYWGGEVDVCINSWTLSNGLWLGVDVDGIVGWFLDHQLDDGGWNCEWVDGATVGSFHSTLNALIALLDYQVTSGDTERVSGARRAGEEYLLQRELFRRRSTGETVGDWALSLAHPRRAYYNVLAAADYFRAAAEADGSAPEPRLRRAITHIRSLQQPDGRWLQGHRLAGDVWFHQDIGKGEPSKFLTLQALRVLGWWDAQAPAHE